jgi:hypothetical protein
MEIIIGLTETFYLTMGFVWTWLSTDIEIPGILTATPIEMMFSWVTLSIILGAILIKKLVPLS